VGYLCHAWPAALLVVGLVGTAHTSRYLAGRRGLQGGMRESLGTCAAGRVAEAPVAIQFIHLLASDARIRAGTLIAVLD
jgi:hypothetical protein